MLIKGTAIRSVLKAIERVGGTDGLARVREALPSDVRAQLDAGFLATKGYPPSVSAALHLAIRDSIGGGTWIMNHKVGIAAAQVDFRGVYRAVLWALDYDSLFERLTRAWSQYNSAGVVSFTKDGNSARLVIEDVEGFNAGMWSAIGGRLEGLLMMCGAKSAHVQVISSSETGCTIEARWAP